MYFYYLIYYLKDEDCFIGEIMLSLIWVGIYYYEYYFDFDKKLAIDRGIINYFRKDV